MGTDSGLVLVCHIRGGLNIQRAVKKPQRVQIPIWFWYVKCGAHAACRKGATTGTVSGAVLVCYMRGGLHIQRAVKEP